MVGQNFPQKKRIKKMLNEKIKQLIERNRTTKAGQMLGESADVSQNSANVTGKFNILSNNGETNFNSEPSKEKKYSYHNKISVRLSKENLDWINSFPNRSRKINEAVTMLRQQTLNI